MKKIVVFFMMFWVWHATADETCGNGWTLSSTIGSASAVATRGGTCYAGYQIYTGNLGNFRFVPQSGAIICPFGQHMSNGTCVSDSQGSCANGFHDSGATSGTAVQPLGGICYVGFAPQVTNRNIAYLITSSAQTCGSGGYPTANGCGTNPTGDCPTNYFQAIPTTAFVRAGADDTCPTNYSAYNDTDLCANMTSFCTPQLPCTAGGTSLRTSTGIILPLYRERATTPSLNVGFESGDICYVNLAPGTANGAINVSDQSGNAYHCVE